MTLPTGTVTAHPLAELVPPMSEAEYRDLVEDVRAHGLQVPIMLLDGKVLDGRHRLRACVEAGMEPRFVDYEGDSPGAFVVSMNVHRRHLSPSQRAMLAVDRQEDLARADRPTSGDVNRSGTAARIAAVVGVGEAQVVRAKRIVREDPVLADKVRAGDVTVREAVRHIAAATKTETPAPAPNGHMPLTKRQVEMADAARRRIAKAVHTLDGMCSGIKQINVAQATTTSTDEEIDEWLQALSRSISTLKELRTALRP